MAFHWLFVKLAPLINHGPDRDLFSIFFIDTLYSFILAILLFFLPLICCLFYIFIHGSQEKWKEINQEIDQERDQKGSQA